LVTLANRVLVSTWGQQPKVLYARSLEAVVKVDDKAALPVPKDISNMTIAVDTLRSDLLKPRLTRAKDSLRNVAVMSFHRSGKEFVLS
jgi:hypothetical protein